MALVKASRDALLKPLQVVAGIVEKKNTMPILANVLIQKQGTELRFVATDTEMQVSTILAVIAMTWPSLFLQEK